MAIVELAWHPSYPSDLALGVNFVWDDIPSDPRDPDGVAGPLGPRKSLDEYIAGGYIVYTGRQLEILVEGQYILHQRSGSDYNNIGGYAQISYKAGRWTPYYRFDLLEIDSNDPFYAVVPEAVDTRKHTVGLRLDWTSFLALKLEYQRVNSTGRDANVVVLQTAVRF
jgi:hypothetical protein